MGGGKKNGESRGKKKEGYRERGMETLMHKLTPGKQGRGRHKFWLKVRQIRRLHNLGPFELYLKDGG